MVEVRSKEEILATLDGGGRLDRLPFMPEMFAFCGKRFRVAKRAHKTCDTVDKKNSRWMIATVHLEGLRCDGSSHGGCEAGCLVHWKEAWLKPVGGAAEARPRPSSQAQSGCSEAALEAATRRPGPVGPEGPAYVCQATELPGASEPLAWWDPRQYVEDYTSGNVGLWAMFSGIVYRTYDNIIKSGIGLGKPMRWVYDRFQRLRGGVPYPARTGSIPVGERTPTKTPELRAGDLVRIKSYEEILATLDQSGKNRGMWFDAEMVPFCGKTYRVRNTVTRIVDEKEGHIRVMNNRGVILDGVACEARYSSCRLFCPRNLYPFWREVWLERVSQPVPASK
jgi:hypothetical protein